MSQLFGAQLSGLIVLLAFGLTLPVQAQSTTEANIQETTLQSTWRQTVGQQHAEMLRSRSDDIRAVAMQNVIVLASRHHGTLDLTPVVPALLGIYENDANNSQHRIMAVAALRAVGDKYGMDQLYLLSEQEPRASRTYQIAQNAAKHYYTQEAMEHEEARSAYYLAKGDLEKAEKHALRAAVHRSRLG